MVYLDLRLRATDFAPNAYYVFHNANSPNNSLSAGELKNGQAAVSMTKAWVTTSAENWVLHYQQGVYFIRNYNFGGQYQLGLDENSPVVPRLMRKTGDLNQQWTMERQGDGTYKFHNGLLGDISALALASAGGNSQPGMQSAAVGSQWEIIVNPSAEAPKDPTMLQDVSDFKVQTTSTSLLPSSTSTSLPSSTSLPLPTTTNSNTNLASTLPPKADAVSPTKSSSLAPGAIAGIAVGIVLILALVTLLCYILWSRRRPKEEGTPELGADQKMYYAHYAASPGAARGVQHAHVAHQGPPVQLDATTVRYEMEHAPVGGEMARLGKTPSVTEQHGR